MLINFSLYVFAALSAQVFVNPCIDVTSPILSDIPCILNEMSDVGIEISFGVTFSFKYKVNFLKSDPSGIVIFERELQFISESVLLFSMFLLIFNSLSLTAFLKAV